ncbi:hypothetical protein Tco_0989702 [Tanacetum coccineum]|uniref:Uncharacterized protein n=1 Tax=Tanacetum coccineum TaxID=301880 RepID=A0ABQ5EV44_9ASTR
MLYNIHRSILVTGLRVFGSVGIGRLAHQVVRCVMDHLHSDRTVITYEAEAKRLQICGAASEDVRFLHDLAYIPESQENQSQP